MSEKVYLMSLMDGARSGARDTLHELGGVIFPPCPKDLLYCLDEEDHVSLLYVEREAGRHPDEELCVFASRNEARAHGFVIPEAFDVFDEGREKQVIIVRADACRTASLHQKLRTLHVGEHMPSK